MNSIKTTNTTNTTSVVIEEKDGSIYVPNSIFSEDQLSELEYVTEILDEMMRSKQKSIRKVDEVFIDESRVVFSEKCVAAANIIMAISVFKSFKEQGLLMENEYLEIVSDEEKRWRNLLSDDNTIMNRIVIEEELYEQKSSNLCESLN